MLKNYGNSFTVHTPWLHKNKTNRMDPASVGDDQDHEPPNRTPKELDGVQQNEVQSLKSSDSQADQREATVEPSNADLIQQPRTMDWPGSTV